MNTSCDKKYPSPNAAAITLHIHLCLKCKKRYCSDRKELCIECRQCDKNVSANEVSAEFKGNGSKTGLGEFFTCDICSKHTIRTTDSVCFLCKKSACNTCLSKQKTKPDTVFKQVYDALHRDEYLKNYYMKTGPEDCPDYVCVCEACRGDIKKDHESIVKKLTDKKCVSCHAIHKPEPYKTICFKCEDMYCMECSTTHLSRGGYKVLGHLVCIKCLPSTQLEQPEYKVKKPKRNSSKEKETKKKKKKADELPKKKKGKKKVERNKKTVASTVKRKKSSSSTKHNKKLVPKKKKSRSASIK
jgi:hypothetical protein